MATAPNLRTVAERMVAEHRVSDDTSTDLRVVSISNPEPVLRRFNVLGIAGTTQDARRAVVALEGIEADDASIGVVVLGTEPAEPADGRVDPEGVTKAVGPRLLVGGLVGFVVGAIVIGGGAWLLDAGGATIGAALGGGAMGAVFGAIWVVFARLGGSDAYRQTFVEHRGEDVTLVSLHTDDADEAAEAKRRLHDLRVVEVSQSGDVAGVGTAPARSVGPTGRWARRPRWAAW